MCSIFCMQLILSCQRLADTSLTQPQQHRRQRRERDRRRFCCQRLADTLTSGRCPGPPGFQVLCLGHVSVREATSTKCSAPRCRRRGGADGGEGGGGKGRGKGRAGRREAWARPCALFVLPPHHPPPSNLTHTHTHTPSFFILWVHGPASWANGKALPFRFPPPFPLKKIPSPSPHPLATCTRRASSWRATSSIAPSSVTPPRRVTPCSRSIPRAAPSIDGSSSERKKVEEALRGASFRGTSVFLTHDPGSDALPEPPDKCGTIDIPRVRADEERR